MKKNGIVLVLSALTATLGLMFSGCYTRVASYDENGTTFWDRNQDTTSQSQAYDNNDYDRYGDHTYLGFEYYTPSPYWGYDSWDYNGGYYGGLWSYYNSPWYYGAYMASPFLYYPGYPYYYYPYHHHHGYYYGGYYTGYGYYGGGGYASAGGYGFGARNSGYTRRGSQSGIFGNSGRQSSIGNSGAYVSSPGSGYAVPTRTGAQTSRTSTGATVRTGRTSTVTSGTYAVPTRTGARTVTPGNSNASSRGQQGSRSGTERSGGYSRGSSETRHEPVSRPTYTPPSYVPSRGSQPHYTPPPSNSGRSGGGENRSSGGSRGRGR